LKNKLPISEAVAMFTECFTRSLNGDCLFFQGREKEEEKEEKES